MRSAQEQQEDTNKTLACWDELIKNPDDMDCFMIVALENVERRLRGEANLCDIEENHPICKWKTIHAYGKP